MIHRNLEIHNVAELLSGDGEAVVPLASRPTLKDWHVADAEFLGAAGEGLWFSRIPDALRLQLNPLALTNALQATGAELRFNLRSARARVTLACNQRPAIAEVWQGCFHVGWHVIGAEPTTIEIKSPDNLDLLVALTTEYRLPFDARLTRVLLPWRPPARLISLEGDFQPPRPGQTPARRYLAYGSSITHGNASVAPSATFAARTAQLLGADLINLGFGGGAHLESAMADYIAARDDWDFATLETGINIGGVGRDEFARRIDYFIETIARAHPDKWIFCLGVFNCRHDLQGDPLFAGYREIVAAKVARLGLPRLVYLDDRALLPSVAGLTADLVHPSPFGMEEIARNLSTVLATKIN